MVALLITIANIITILTCILFYILGHKKGSEYARNQADTRIILMKDEMRKIWDENSQIKYQEGFANAISRFILEINIFVREEHIWLGDNDIYIHSKPSIHNTINGNIVQLKIVNEVKINSSDSYSIENSIKNLLYQPDIKAFGITCKATINFNRLRSSELSENIIKNINDLINQYNSASSLNKTLIENQVLFSVNPPANIKYLLSPPLNLF